MIPDLLDMYVYLSMCVERNEKGMKTIIAGISLAWEIAESVAFVEYKFLISSLDINS